MIPPATARPYEHVALHVLQIRSDRYRHTGIDVPTSDSREVGPVWCESHRCHSKVSLAPGWTKNQQIP
jgi:hypothetical protein